jgi:hypothetical protein
MYLGYVRNSDPLHISSLSYSRIVENLKDFETIFTYGVNGGFIRFSSCDYGKLPQVFYCDRDKKVYALEKVSFITDLTVNWPNNYIIDYRANKIVFREVTLTEIIFLY